ncbi:hypothetical protein SBP18_05300 [Rhodoferax ferrireducens]|uniref:hypothetical protein n=1 Tax=Rhodoferax ferrireducens TaxID=192843 RepID=UPI0005A1A76B|nr:hypothetical protein [Rhodoferax ferrireducens]WPC67929.1 hypothetical protein SBP18_05300 [Rhodoferax ferrireducens]
MIELALLKRMLHEQIVIRDGVYPSDNHTRTTQKRARHVPEQYARTKPSVNCTKQQQLGGLTLDNEFGAQEA